MLERLNEVLHGDVDDQGDEHEPDLSVAAVVLDTVADAAAAAGVAAAGAINPGN